jgi:hypothetical protein
MKYTVSKYSVSNITKHKLTGVASINENQPAAKDTFLLHILGQENIINSFQWSQWIHLDLQD